MRLERSGLEAEGFLGFIPFAAMPTAGVPVGAGVYVVYRTATSRRACWNEAPAATSRARTRPCQWQCSSRRGVTGARVLNIGKAALGSSGRRGLFKRLNEYRRFGTGEPIAH